MEEPLKRSVLDIINSLEENHIFRLIYFAEIKCFEKVTSYFADYSNNNFFDKVSGLLLIYPTTILHLIEAEEDMLYVTCLDLMMSNDNGLGTSRCFPVYPSESGRLFHRWYMKRINFPSEDGEFMDMENMMEIKKFYFDAVDEFSRFFLELTSDAFDAKELKKKLDDLPQEKSSVPSEKIIKSLLNISRGFELSSLTEKYWNNGLTEKEDIIWPIGEIQEPSIFSPVPQ